MTPDRFTIKAQEAIAAAGALAESRRHPQTTPEHLLAVLLEQDGGMVAPVLRKLGVSPDAVRGTLNELLDLLPTTTAGSEAAGPSADLVSVLRAAEHEMRELGDEYISTEHVLLSLSGHASKAGETLRAEGAVKEALL